MKKVEELNSISLPVFTGIWPAELLDRKPVRYPQNYANSHLNLFVVNLELAGGKWPKLKTEVKFW
jgi:hypothetical protein